MKKWKANEVGPRKRHPAGTAIGNLQSSVCEREISNSWITLSRTRCNNHAPTYTLQTTSPIRVAGLRCASQRRNLLGPWDVVPSLRKVGAGLYRNFWRARRHRYMGRFRDQSSHLRCTERKAVYTPTFRRLLFTNPKIPESFSVPILILMSES